MCREKPLKLKGGNKMEILDLKEVRRRLGMAHSFSVGHFYINTGEPYSSQVKEVGYSFSEDEPEALIKLDRRDSSFVGFAIDESIPLPDGYYFVAEGKGELKFFLDGKRGWVVCTAPVIEVYCRNDTSQCESGHCDIVVRMLDVEDTTTDYKTRAKVENPYLLPELTGSPKQIVWAEKLRDERLDSLEFHLNLMIQQNEIELAVAKSIMDYFETQKTSASFWIDYRILTTPEIIERHMAKEI
ncbi:hypothetical protein HMPREF9555_01797 [Selenomonas artemidis F0399]|jgi:hypothetical protein|uniref:Uncharacterized protein n=2 Tax=Selenomonas TaxID=970 RepID=E7N456_9FIRM|nr:hypothetical protein HMPREF9555_01797 [Selenomonas artemidis F0399]